MHCKKLWFTSFSLLIVAAAHAQPGSVPYIAINQAEVDGQIWGIPGDGATDATTKLQAAVTYAVTNHRTLLLRRPAVAYKITSKINIGTGVSVAYGLDLVGVGQPRILWAGGATCMFDCISLAESRIENIWLDGGNVAGSTGVRARCTAGFPGQRLTFRGCMFENCESRGVRLIQDVNATSDYYRFDECAFVDNGVGLRVEGDIRQVDIDGGAFTDNTTYGIDINSGWVNIYDALFAGNGSGSYYLGSNLAGLYACRSVHEEWPVLTGGGNWNTYSPLISPITLIAVKQDIYTLPFPAGNAITYNAYKPLDLIGCIWVQSIDIGADAMSVTSTGNEFIASAYSGIDAKFTGHTEKLVGNQGLDQPITLDFDGSWDNESWPLAIQVPIAGNMVLYDVYAYCVGSNTPTLTFNLEKRAVGTINTAGTDVFAAPVTATAAGAHFTAFINSDLAAGTHLWWKTGTAAASGTVDAVKLVIKGR